MLYQYDTLRRPITFEGGSLTNVASGVDSVVATVNLETVAPLKGSYSATFPVTNTTGYLDENIASTSDLYVSFYLKAASFPASARLVQIRNGSTTIGSSSALSANTLYRIGLRQSSGSGTGVLQAYLASGDAAFGSAFASSSVETISGQASELRIGATNSSAVSATVDDIRLDTAAMPGPSSSGGATATPTNTPTRTPTPTNTPTGPTATPTNTPTGPTATPTRTPTATAGPSPTPAAASARVVTYAYDGLQRLIGASENPGTSSSYSYDLAGNRTDGGKTYNAILCHTNCGSLRRQLHCFKYNGANRVTRCRTQKKGRTRWMSYSSASPRARDGHSSVRAAQCWPWLASM